MPDLTVTAAVASGARAFAEARLRPADVDSAQLYDAFTITPILFLEDLGFCEKGEGGAFVAGGAIAPGGKLRVNTSGGGLSYGHPGMNGLPLLVEAVREVREEGKNVGGGTWQRRRVERAGDGPARERGGGRAAAADQGHAVA